MSGWKQWDKISGAPVALFVSNDCPHVWEFLRPSCPVVLVFLTFCKGISYSSCTWIGLPPSFNNQQFLFNMLLLTTLSASVCGLADKYTVRTPDSRGAALDQVANCQEHSGGTIWHYSREFCQFAPVYGTNFCAECEHKSSVICCNKSLSHLPNSVLTQ